MENLVILTVKSTHFYLVACPSGWLLVDAGWPGSLHDFKAELKQHGLQFADIRYVMLTHHHPDHAGLVQEIKNVSGAKLIIHEQQIPFLKDLLGFFEGKGNLDYLPVQVEPGDLVLGTPNREALKALGIQGEALLTPGHSADSLSLVLDSGLAFTGDLTPPNMVSEENEAAIKDSWTRILAAGAKTIYPAHTGPVTAEQISEYLEYLA
jgi:endoribonuclease LACTB2